jgi:transposase-like protein
MERRGRYPTEVKERAVRLVFEQQAAHTSLS